MAHLAYFDESGDAGVVNSPTRFFVLACVLIPEAQWMSSLDSLVLLRGRLKARQARRMPGLRTFGIAIDKTACAAKGRDPREAAWQFALQRVDRFCRSADSRALLFPDEGQGRFIKRLTRRYRRFQNIAGAFGGSRSIPLHRILEDPNDRESHDSYFIQLADWNAYAAHRSGYVAPSPAVPHDLWDSLGGCRLLDVNAVRGGPPGIVLWP